MENIFKIYNNERMNFKETKNNLNESAGRSFKSKHFHCITAAMILLCVLFSFGCAKNKNTLRFDLNKETGSPIPYPNVSFAVISDVHIYDPSLGTSGSAFEKTMSSDRKLLLDSIDLLEYAIADIITSPAGFVIISGDLTKDGELINHHLMAEKLNRFKNAGIPAFVVPGNHDINNPDAVSYSGGSTAPVPTVSAADYMNIYGEFGYNAALMRDDDSVSYVVEPLEGLWLLCLDACRYRENVPGKGEIVSGKISQKTADWIAAVLKDAGARKKAVIAVIHHGVVEHWKGQSKLHPDYLIQEFAAFSEFLASWNVRLVFTGHYHAQDITLAKFGDKFIYDIETGSLVTAPCPIRYLEIRNNTLSIQTKSIVDKIHPGTDFADKAYAFVKKTVMLEAISTLRKYKVSDRDCETVADAVGDAFTAHYMGDEDPSLCPPFDPGKLNLWGRFIYSQQKYALDGLWADIYPADNNVRIEL